MNKAALIFILYSLAIIMSGCQGGSKIDVSGEESPVDTTRPIIFADNNFLPIDIDMMAQRFNEDQMPMSKTVIDSVTAIETVYNLLLDSLLAVDAANFDLSTQPLLEKQYKDMYDDFLIRFFYDNHIVANVVVDDSMVYVTYEQMKERFISPEKYRARHIVISGYNLKSGEDSLKYKGKSDAELDALARDMVMELRQRAINGEGFDTLAIMYSYDERSAGIGGDLGYFELSKMVAPFDSAIQHTPVDSISGVIKTKYGWHVIKVEDHTEEHYTPVDSLYDGILEYLKKQQATINGQAFLDTLRADANIYFDTAAIAINDTLHEYSDILAIVNADDPGNRVDTITFNEYRAQIGLYMKRNGLAYPLGISDKIEAIREFVLKYVIIAYATEHGYADHPDFRKWSDGTILKYGVATLKKDLLEDGYELTEDELLRYYNDNIEKYRADRPLKVQHVIFSDSSLAIHVRDVANSGADFMELVDQYYPGDPDIKRAAANLGYIGERDMPGAFWRRALATKVGEVSRPVKTEYGYHIIKVLEKTPDKEFAAVKSGIRKMMLDNHKHDLIWEFVEGRLSEPPKIYWDRLGDLYRKPINP
ncbi:MAG: peptidylprolyl isomerase [candidate division Zixibacteria bacterium]